MRQSAADTVKHWSRANGERKVYRIQLTILIALLFAVPAWAQDDADASGTTGRPFISLREGLCLFTNFVRFCGELQKAFKQSDFFIFL